MIEKSYTAEDIADIAKRQGLMQYPKLALYRERLSRKATNEKQYRFYCLYGQLLRMDVLKCAYEQVRANKGSPGVDNLTFDDIEQSDGGVSGFLTSIQRELKEKKYRPMPVKRVYIEKANGKLRPLGIPTIKDRTVQAAVKLVIEPIFESDFHDCSFGFRPNRNARQAVKRIAANVRIGRTDVYDADLSGYFDTIPHDKLVLALRKRITDGSILGLILSWLKSTIIEPNGTRTNPHGRGTPQGGVISPLLSNVYLHWFETLAMAEARRTRQDMVLVRYADDFVILSFKLKQDFIESIERGLEGRFGLTINREKTKIFNMRETREALNFLGFEFKFVKDRNYGRGDTYLTYGPSMKSVKKVCQKVKERTRNSMALISIEDTIRQLNKILVGWENYFNCGYPSREFSRVNDYTQMRLYRFTRKKSQRGFRRRYAKSFYGEMKARGLHMLKWKHS